MRVMELSLDDAVDGGFSAQLEWLRKLVELPSNTDDKEDVERAAEFVDSTMSDMGFDIETTGGGLRAYTRIYHLNLPQQETWAEEESALALVGHVDTVYPTHWDWNQDVDDGYIRGPGVMDMKGGLSVIVFALKALQATNQEVFESLKVRFYMNTDEEKGSGTSKHVFEDFAPQMSKALVFEPGRTEPERDKIVVERKGSAPFDISATVTGFPQHAGGRHEEGANALHALMLLAHKIESMTDYESGLTFNVVIDPEDDVDDDSKMNSTMKRNVLPGYTKFQVDCRYVNKGSVDEAIESLREDIANWNFPGLSEMNPRLIKRVERADLVIHFTSERDCGRPPMPSAPNIELCERYSRHADACGLGSGPASIQGGVSDANNIADNGVPVIDGLGPYGKNAHSLQDHDEWFDPESLRKKTKALARFLFEETILTN